MQKLYQSTTPTWQNIWNSLNTNIRLMELLKFSGIIGPLVFIFGTYLLTRKVKFDFNKQQVSLIVGFPKVGRIFYLLLIFSVFLQFIFVVEIIYYYHLWNNLLISSIFLVTLTSGIVASLFPVNKFFWVHVICAFMSFFGAILIGIIFGIYFFNINKIVGLLQITDTFTVAAILFVKGFRIDKKYGTYTIPAKYEYVFITGLLFWNIINTIPMI